MLLDTLQVHDSAPTKAELLHILQSTLRSHVKSPKDAMLETVKVILAFMPEDLTNGDIHKAVTVTCGNGSKQKDKEAVVRLLADQRDDVGLALTTFHKLVWSKAIRRGNVNLCKILLDKGLEPPWQEELDALVSAANSADSVAALEYLLTREGESDTILTGTRLYNAICDQKTHCAVFLIDQGAPIDHRSPTGNTCLLEASMLNDNAAARKLLEKGADPNVHGAGITDTPLEIATIRRDKQMVGELLHYGADVHGQDGQASALATAMFIGFFEGVESMVHSSSFASATEDKRNSYISIALSLPDHAWEMAATFNCILHDGGVNTNCVLRDMGGTTPLHLAVIRPRPLAFNLLLKHGAKMHQRQGLVSEDDEDTVGMSKTTPLEFAIHRADPDIVYDMLSQLPLSPEDAESEDCPFSWLADELREVLTPQLLADYVRAARYRMKRSMFVVLVDFKLDFHMRDPRTGDRALHMICDALDLYHTREPGWEPANVGVRAAASILLLLEEGINVDPKIQNIQGVSALQLVRRIMDYSGDDHFWEQVAGV